MLAAVIGFGAGYGVQTIAAADVHDELDQARQAATLSDLQNTLAAAAIEAQRGSYEVARQLASRFFSGLQQSLQDLPPEWRQDAAEVLGRRDAVITALSRANPDSGELLARLFLQLQEARDEQVEPAATPGTTGSP